MKKTLVLLIAMFAVFAANAQDRVKIKEGLYLVSYGNTAVIEDDVNQQTISLTITKEIKDYKTGESTYNVVCGKWSKRVVKDGLKAAIAGGIAASGASGGTSIIISAASTLAMYIYDDVCEYYDNKFK